MKILFYNHTGKVSGAERVLLMILPRLDRERYDPVLFCPSDGPLQGMAAALGTRTIEAEPLNVRFTWRPDHLVRYLMSCARAIGGVRRVVVKEAPEIIHANSVRAGLVMSMATIGLGQTIVWHVHDLLPKHPLSSAIRLTALLCRRIQILGVSNAVADRFRGSLFRWFPRRVQISTIYNAVDAEEFFPDQAARETMRRALGFGQDDLVVGIVGQLTPRKGQLELIQAFTAVSERHRNATLLIVGEAVFDHDQNYKTLLASEVADNKRIRFLGHRSDVANLIRAFDLLVVNSNAEPFGLTVVEAMAGGTAVLATSDDGIREIIQHNVNGWLIPKSNHEALIDGLLKLLGDTNLRARLSAIALPYVLARFSVKTFIEQIESLYQTKARNSEMPQAKIARGLAVKLSAD